MKKIIIDALKYGFLLQESVQSYKLCAVFASEQIEANSNF